MIDEILFNMEQLSSNIKEQELTNNNAVEVEYRLFY